MRIDQAVRGARASGPRVPAAALLLAVVLGGACSGGGSGGGDGGLIGRPPSPPTDLRALGVADAPDDVQLYWVPPPEAIDGYLVELKIGAGAYQARNDQSSLVPLGWTGLRVTLAPGSPDLVDYAVRLRAVRAGVASSASNEAVYHRPLNPPRDVVARFDWTLLAPIVAWTRDSTAATSAILQRAELDAYGVPGPWTPLALDPTALSLVDQTAQRDHVYRYQVANVAGAVTSASAFSAPFFAGLGSPVPVSLSFDPAQDVVLLSQASVNPDADGLRLERQLVDASHAPLGPWGTVDVGTGVRTSLADATWPEDALVKYRLSNLRGGLASPPATFAQAVSTPLYRPAALAARSAADGAVTLSWQNRSLAATQVEVSWSPQIGETGVRSILATLPATATTCDLGGLGLGYYKLTVAASTSLNTGASTLDYTTPDPAGALSLSSTSLWTYGPTDAALRPDGTWVFLSRFPTTLSVSGTDRPWPAVQRLDVVPDSLAGTAPVLASDASGRPHVVYLAKAGDGGDPILTHLWYDGAAWTSEVMYRGPLATGYGGPAFQAVLDQAGTPQALVVLKAGASMTAALVRRGNTAWASEAVPLPAFSLGLDRLVAFGLDGAGDPHLVLNRTEYTRSGAGAWTSSPIAPISGLSEPHAPQDAVWVDARNAVVLVFGLGTGSDAYEVGVVEKVAGAWQPLRLLGKDRRTYGVFPPMRLAASADGARVLILYGTEVGVRAYHRDAGAWGVTLVAPPQTVTPYASWPSGFLRAGFDSRAKARLLVGKDSAFLDVTER